LAAFENELGAQEPLGFFDPLGLVANGDEAKFNRLRYVEIKHGRISMLAVAGYLVAEAGKSRLCFRSVGSKSTLY
jgi:Chlorophyll A-B binding protein